jgi:hypothetical protein
MSLPVFVSDTEKFVAEEAFLDGPTPPIGLDTDEKVRGFVSALWDAAVEGMRPEQDRMKRCSLYYDGFHYENPRDNIELEITNYPFSIVETVWPQLVESKPRPEVQAGYGVSTGLADRLNKYFTWMMNTNGFDRAYRNSMRELLKLGWSSSLVTFDPKTGIAYPKCWNNWNLYWDPNASHEEDALYFCLAGPVPTFMLKQQFPDKASQIKPDNWVSPSYDVLVKPWQEMFSGFGASSAPKMSGHASYDTGFTPLRNTSDSVVGGSTTLTQPGQTVKTLGAATTFLIQVIFRDVTPMPVVYRGKRYVKTPYGEISHPHYIQRNELVCKSGWRVAQVTASGTVLNVAPLDKCFGGLPFVMHRDYEQAFRMWSFGEIDQIISKTRSLNYRSQLVTLALEFAANPVILADAENAASIEGGTVSAGSVVKKKRGSEIRWMEPPQIGPEFFSFYQKQTQDIDVISGIHDVQQGQRPVGIQTGVAIQSLQSAANQRIRGKSGGIFDSYALLLHKLAVSNAMKANRRIQFRATDGKDITIDPEEILSEYHIKFVEGSGVQQTRETMKATAERLFQLGAIDEMELLKAEEWPGFVEVAQRMAQRNAMLAIDKAKALGQSTDSGGGEKP